MSDLFCTNKDQTKKKKTKLTETNLPRTAHSSPVMPTQIHIEPTNNNRHGCISSHGDQEESCILQVVVVVHGNEDSEAGDADANGENGKEEAMSEAIGEIRNKHGKAKSSSPRRHTMELGLDGRVAVALDDGGRKVCIAICGYDQAKIHQATDKNLGVFEDICDVSRFDGALAGGAALVDLEAVLDIGTLRLR